MSSILQKGQTLWFVDKNTKQKACVEVDKTGKENFTFLYHGKEIICPYNKLEKRIYTFPQDNKPIIFYLGEFFIFDKDNWVRYDQKVYGKSHQQKLSKVYAIRKNFYSKSVGFLLKRANEMRVAGKCKIAISYYEIILAKSNLDGLNDFLAELSSLYRKFGNPNASIELYKYISKQYYNYDFTFHFLTFVAAAYVDIGKKEDALQLADYVYGKSGGHKSDELQNLYFRINALG